MPNHKRSVHHAWTKFRIIHPLFLGVLLLISATIAVLALRQNNQMMAEKRQAVYSADEQGGDVEGALRDLREFVYGHMNTSLSTGENAVYPPIQLKYTYERLQEAQQAEIKAKNARIYTDAQQHCEALHPESYSGGPRVPCIGQYIEEHGVELPSIPDSLYKFDFTAARFSWDLAGLSLITTGLLLVVLLTRLIAPALLRAFRV